MRSDVSQVVYVYNTIAGRITGQQGHRRQNCHFPFCHRDVRFEGAQITVLAADTVNTTALSDADGKYTIQGLLAGSYRVVAEAGGFIASDTLDVQIDVANVTRQDFLLEIEPPVETETPAEGN